MAYTTQWTAQSRTWPTSGWCLHGERYFFLSLFAQPNLGNPRIQNFKHFAVRRLRDLAHNNLPKFPNTSLDIVPVIVERLVHEVAERVVRPEVEYSGLVGAGVGSFDLEPPGDLRILQFEVAQLATRTGIANTNPDDEAQN